MRATLFLSALFAVSLVGGAALAERPTEGGEGRRPAREPKLLDLKPHETTVREKTTHEKASREKTDKAHGPAVIHEIPNRADNVDRSYAARGVAKANDHGHKAGQGVAKAMDKYKASRNCSDTGSDCSAPRGKAQGNVSDGDKAARKEKQELNARQRAKAQEMIKLLNKLMCERHATTCADYL